MVVLSPPMRSVANISLCNPKDKELQCIISGTHLLPALLCNFLEMMMLARYFATGHAQDDDDESGVNAKSVKDLSRIYFHCR